MKELHQTLLPLSTSFPIDPSQERVDSIATLLDIRNKIKDEDYLDKLLILESLLGQDNFSTALILCEAEKENLITDLLEAPALKTFCQNGFNSLFLEILKLESDDIGIAKVPTLLPSMLLRWATNNNIKYDSLAIKKIAMDFKRYDVIFLELEDYINDSIEEELEGNPYIEETIYDQDNGNSENYSDISNDNEYFMYKASKGPYRKVRDLEKKQQLYCKPYSSKTTKGFYKSKSSELRDIVEQQVGAKQNPIQTDTNLFLSFSKERNFTGMDKVLEDAKSLGYLQEMLTSRSLLKKANSSAISLILRKSYEEGFLEEFLKLDRKLLTETIKVAIQSCNSEEFPHYISQEILLQLSEEQCDSLLKDKSLCNYPLYYEFFEAYLNTYLAEEGNGATPLLATEGYGNELN